MKTNLLLFLCCTVGNIHTSAQSRIVEVFEDGVLIERLYFSEENTLPNLTSVVYFYENLLIKDSIDFTQNIGDTLLIKNFHFAKGNIVEQTEIAYTPSAECEIVSNRSYPKSYGRDFVDICTVSTAVLPNGKSIVSIIDKVRRDSIIEYSAVGINSRINNLSLEINRFFLNQVLNSFKFTFDDKRLISESYQFENGTLSREYTYDSKMLIVKILATYQTGSQFTVIKEYKKL